MLALSSCCLPKEFQPKDQTLPNATYESLDEAMKMLVTTDVWVSMGDEKEKEKESNYLKNIK